MCAELPAVKGVAAVEAENTAGSVVSAVHALCLQLQLKVHRSVHHHIRQRRLPFKWSRAEPVCLRSYVDVEPIRTLALTDLAPSQSECLLSSPVLECPIDSFHTFFFTL